MSVLACRICGRDVRLTVQRFLRLVRLGSKPDCAKCRCMFKKVPNHVLFEFG